MRTSVDVGQAIKNVSISVYYSIINQHAAIINILIFLWRRPMFDDVIQQISNMKCNNFSWSLSTPSSFFYPERNCFTVEIFIVFNTFCFDIECFWNNACFKRAKICLFTLKFTQLQIQSNEMEICQFQFLLHVALHFFSFISILLPLLLCLIIHK